MELDRRTMGRLAGLVLFGVVVGWLLNSLRFPENFAGILWALAYPFILGFIFAFLLNLPMKALNRYLLKGRGGRFNRAILLGSTLLLFLIFLFLFSILLVPQLVDSIATLAQSMPGYLKELDSLLEPYYGYVPGLQNGLSSLDFDWQDLAAKAWGWLQSGAGSVWSAVSGAASSLFSGIAAGIIGLFFAFNVVLGKNKGLHQFTGLLRAYLPDSAYVWLAKAGSLANHVFSAYVGGQCLDALIIGVAYFAVLGIGGFPYALLISVLVAITSFIPLFGVYIAYIIGLFLTAVSAGFWRAVIFTIIFVVLQQIEGNIVYPRVVGSAVGLGPGWVLAAVTLGGGLFGVGGILFFIPLFSVVYKLLHADAKKRLRNKRINH